jgi:hypothetical protein
MKLKDDHGWLPGYDGSKESAFMQLRSFATLHSTCFSEHAVRN